MQAQRQSDPVAKSGWRSYLMDAFLALLTTATVIILVLPLHLHISQATALFGYLFVIFLLAHRRRLGIAILVVLIACVTADFFLTAPLFSLSVTNLEDGLDLALFVLFAFILIYRYSRSQERVEKAIQQENKMSAIQAEETSRHERELHIFATIVREIHNKKDLKVKLGLIAQAIDETFSTSGIQSCIFFLPNLEGKSLQPMIATQPTNACSLSREEEASAIWVMQHGKSVELRSSPPAVQNKDSYSRWIVDGSSKACGSSYIVPLLSGSNIIGGIRFLVDDNTHPRFMSIKKSLERQISGLADSSQDLFLEFLQHAVALIEQALIEEGLKRQEELHIELRHRTDELYQSMIEEGLKRQEELRIEAQHRSDELYTSIISSVSHDLKTPLTLITGAASSLLKQGESWSDEAERRSLLSEIVNEARWLERIITKMLDISRIEQGMWKPDKELYPIETIVLNTLELGHIHTLLQDRQIEKRGLEDLPPVKVDPTMIGQVLGNLLENAARYTPAGSPIEICGQADNEQIVLSIIDRGPGIPEMEKKRIFEKFHRISQKIAESEDTTAANSTFIPTIQGSGLGLTVCQAFVEAHNGRIWVENLDSGGAKFQFTLPLRQKRDRTEDAEDPRH